ncbi:hypothetical protein AX16_009762 [Volvariella volvacea WC 439]|nr:hypothetical protein AX16_009762 [Volvariella volvacea WC 439]
MVGAQTFDDKDVPFEPAGKLPEELIPASMALMKFSGRHLRLQDDGKHFDWPTFFAACEGYKGDGLSLIKSDKTEVQQSEQTVGTIIKKIAEWLHNSYQMTMDLSSLEAIIKSTFTNLKTVSQDSGFLQFNSHKQQSNSSWEYRVVFGVPAPGRPMFHALVTTIYIWADVTEESSWWGLEESTEKSFGVKIVGLELEITKYFNGKEEE